jgi:hypothetical protein
MSEPPGSLQLSGEVPGFPGGAFLLITSVPHTLHFDPETKGTACHYAFLTTMCVL